MFCKFHLENADGFNPLKWWANNQSRFPNVGFMAR